ncbi:MAG: Hsp70 family protein [Prevotella sp.]|jgi:hypothetical protein|nr:Hsp70 family protein [Prevotella sp.]
MIQAHFSQIRSTLTKYIENSTSEICIAVAWFTHRDLFQSILSTLDRKVKVSIILIDDIINRGPNGLDFATYIEKGGTIRFMNTRTLLMHNKFCVFDNQVLITGSYNWTYSAETRNAENIIVTDDINVCNAFNSQFSKLWRDLPEVEKFSHIEFKDVTSEVLLNCFDYLHDEYESMERAQIKNPVTIADIENLKKDISITRLNSIVTNTKRAKPLLKESISLEIVNNKTKIIIKGNQDLPFTNTVDAKTVYDFQDAVNCNIRYGNYLDANKNQLVVQLRIENLPRLKAGEVTFLAKATIDTNGYMHIEFVCINNGISKSAVYNAKDLINYQ